jgi:methionyl-tRNA formyltransferase
MTAPGGRIVVLAQHGAGTNIIVRALSAAFGNVTVLTEDPVPRRQFLARRLKRLGVAQVVGQVLFSTVVVPVLRRRGADRIREILDQAGLDDTPLDQPVIHVPSVNSPEARHLLEALAPAVVVVSGTRIISAATLASVRCPVINMHAGITPQYRGVHGGYWALVEGRRDLVGTTVHLVDTGIDTGPIIAQSTFAVTDRDSFATYPYLHIASGLPALVGAVADALAGRKLEPREPLATDAPSTLRSHPTLPGYLYRRIRSGVA